MHFGPAPKAGKIRQDYVSAEIGGVPGVRQAAILDDDAGWYTRQQVRTGT